MRIISIINLKGGVAKTVSSVNIAHILSSAHNKKVLLIDNDKQGDASKLLNRHSYTRPGTAKILTDREFDMSVIIQPTEYEGLDVVTANMNLLTAALEVMLDQKRPQHNRLKKALEQVKGKYDFCIIDNAPDINISTINALAASDDVLVPIDDFSIDGLKELVEQRGIRVAFVKNLLGSFQGNHRLPEISSCWAEPARWKCPACRSGCAPGQSSCGVRQPPFQA